MDVFLVPVGRDAYELYCEHVDEPEAHDDPREEPLPDTFWARLFLPAESIADLQVPQV